MQMLREVQANRRGLSWPTARTQRNLSEKGRADALAMGARLRAEEVTVTKILSSPWCRCLDTANLLRAAPVEVEPAFSNAFVLRERREELKEGAIAVLSKWTSGTLLVVTHGANILDLTGYNPASGEIVVVTPRTSPLRVIGRIPVPN